MVLARALMSAYVPRMVYCPMLLQQPTTPLGHFRHAIDHVAVAVQEYLRRDPTVGAFLLALGLFLQGRKKRLGELFLAWQAGALPSPRQRRSGARKPRDPAKPGRERLPGGFGWLHVMLDGAIMPGREELHAVLDDAQMAAFVAACPQARRILRQLCRMFGIKPTDAQLPPDPPRARQPKPAPEPSPQEQAEPSPRAAGRGLGEGSGYSSDPTPKQEQAPKKPRRQPWAPNPWAKPHRFLW